jgi:hypothetical protein
MHSSKINEWCDEAGGFVAMEGTMGGRPGTGYNTNYQPPPPQQLSYAEQQSQMVEESMFAYMRAENSANAVLMTLQSQRQQLQKANDDTWTIRMNAIKAQQQLKELQQKAWRKKKCLYLIIAVLVCVDTMLFMRLVHCGGSFICRHYRGGNY